MSTRLIAVDDTSPLISYQGPWTKEDAVSDTYSTPGDYSPFNNTLHSLSGSGSFSFIFTGTSVSVIGHSNSTLPPSQWSCYIDGTRLNSFDPNNVEICSSSQIIINRPVVNLTVLVSGTTDMPFLLDYIQYAPVASSIPDNATVLVDAFDTQITYRDNSGRNDSGWIISGDQVETSMGHASMIFDFVGTQVTWIAGSPHVNSSTRNSLGAYSIDNGTLFPFPVTVPSSDQWAYFQTSILPHGSHLLYVEYVTLNGSLPLTLDHFIVQNLTSPPLTPSPSSSNNLNPHTRLSRGAIAGVAIGSLVGLALVMFIISWTIRLRFINIRKNGKLKYQSNYSPNKFAKF